MMKKRSRPLISTNQAQTADPLTVPSPTASFNRPASPLFPLSPRLFAGFSPKGFADHEMSPTSTLETKPFARERTPSSQRKPLAPEPVGLVGIVDGVEEPAKNEGSRKVVFGSKLKIQIPSVSNSAINSSSNHPQSPIEFGLKTRSSHLGWVSPERRPPSPMVCACFSASEMEMSEDYTCVIEHGPNPKTIHIFEDCIVESLGDGFVAVTPRQEDDRRASGGFLTSCDACKKKLGEGNDIFIYRGEKAFCSRECRDQGMLDEDEEMEDSFSKPSADL